MIAWVLGLEGCHLGYFIHYDSYINGVIKQNNKSPLLKLEVENKTFETKEGIFDIVSNYSTFLELANLKDKIKKV